MNIKKEVVILVLIALLSSIVYACKPNCGDTQTASPDAFAGFGDDTNEFDIDEAINDALKTNKYT